MAGEKSNALNMHKKTSFLPMYLDEMAARGWGELDVIIISGDAYVDHPSYGTALIGRLLESKGYRVGIIAQPDWRSLDDFTRLGRPRLCVCVTAGNVDSMVAHYTANKRRRQGDDFAPGGKDGLRPDRAAIVYANRAKAAFKGLPVILGGVEASMRRLAHYDYWDDAVRRSVLIDAKADMIIYGMAERPVVEVMARLAQGEAIAAIRDVRGTVVRVKPAEFPAGTIELPSFEDISRDPEIFNQAFRLAYAEMSPEDGKPLAQRHADQCVLQLPPALPLTPQELDAGYDLAYARTWHPSYDALGGVKGLETVRWSITAVRGCPGECHFCGITFHQGRIVQSRSVASIVREAEGLARDPAFRGTIQDVGGPTANLYGASCANWNKGRVCRGKQCLMPSKCPSLDLGCREAVSLYEAIRRVPGIKHMFVQSGLRYDLLLEPAALDYFKVLCRYHVSGQMKVAPEHTSDEVLALMNKPPYARYEAFVRLFNEINAGLGKKQFLVNYFVSAHPGAGLKEAFDCASMLLSRGMHPEQVQDFLPLPMTVSACMYHTGKHPLTGKSVYVPRKDNERAMQRALVQSQNPGNAPLIDKALNILGKQGVKKKFK